MKFIFSTGSLYNYGLDRCFALAAEAGFDGLELMIDQRWDTRHVSYLKRLIDRYHRPIMAVHSPFVMHLPGWPGEEAERIKESVKLAEAVGAEVVVHHLPFRVRWVWAQLGSRRWPVPLPWRRGQTAYRDWLLRGYGAFQAGLDVKLCIENMPARRWLGGQFNAYYWNTLAEMARFSAITLDTTHLGTWGLEPGDVYPQLDGRVGHIHLSNFDGREHRRPEAGHLALDRLLAQVAASGYQGAIALELQPDALEAGQADEQIVALLKASLAYCRTWAKIDRERSETSKFDI